MDGNGRWAKKHHVPRLAGHNAGVKAVRAIVTRANDLGVKHLTVYAFSTENWKRSEEEVSGIFGLLIHYLDLVMDELNDNNVKVNLLGDLTGMPQNVVDKINESLPKTSNNTGLNFNIAFNYGGRAEIIRAVKEMKDEEITEENLSKHLYTGDFNIPDPELIIRTSGEERLSNFLLWQAAYSEFVFCDELWPDFTAEVFERCIEEYQSRDRRFGGRN